MQGPPDPILGIAEAYKKSTNPKKLNLGKSISMAIETTLILLRPHH